MQWTSSVCFPKAYASAMGFGPWDFVEAAVQNRIDDFSQSLFVKDGSRGARAAPQESGLNGSLMAAAVAQHANVFRSFSFRSWMPGISNKRSPRKFSSCPRNADGRELCQVRLVPFDIRRAFPLMRSLLPVCAKGAVRTPHCIYVGSWART